MHIKPSHASLVLRPFLSCPFLFFTLHLPSSLFTLSSHASRGASTGMYNLTTSSLRDVSSCVTKYLFIVAASFSWSITHPTSTKILATTFFHSSRTTNLPEYLGIRHIQKEFFCQNGIEHSYSSNNGIHGTSPANDYQADRHRSLGAIIV